MYITLSSGRFLTHGLVRSDCLSAQRTCIATPNRNAVKTKRVSTRYGVMWIRSLFKAYGTVHHFGSGETGKLTIIIFIKNYSLEIDYSSNTI